MEREGEREEGREEGKTHQDASVETTFSHHFPDTLIHTL